MDYFENEIREIIMLMNDKRYDGFTREGMIKKLQKIRDLIDRELKNNES